MMAQGNEPMLSSYLHARGAKLGLPISGTFELTARCNFSCPMCYVHLCNARVEQELSAAQWLTLARQAKDRGMVFVLLTGGEPLIRSDFFEIFDGMKEMGLLVSINTNGSLINNEILRKLIDNPPNRMNITLYGGCSETYRNMCRQDAFDTVVDHIRQLKSAGIDVRLNYSITPYNCNDMQRIWDISQEMNVHIKGSSYMYPPVRSGNGSDCLRFTAEESAAWGVQWNRTRLPREEFELWARSAECMDCSVDMDDGVSCRAGITSFWLTWDGRMLPCGMMNGPAVDVCASGFDEAWNQIRDEVRRIRMPRECARCPKRPMCSVCAAVCLSETGRFDAVPEYVCRRTDETIRLMQEVATKENI